MKKKDKSIFLTLNLVVQFFLETFVLMVLGYYFGQYLDNKFLDGETTYIYVFVFLGIFAGIANFIKRALKMSKGEEDEKDQSD
ncbi:MAG: AtpZ/AtpI family protein [Candidatus Izemoplasmatales bacterium]|nr:AtpZ/AtpI family protein [Candidatus Izemoplasmatales bacterium]